MPTESELLEAIEECENKESSFDNCVKLAIFHMLMDYYYCDNNNNKNNSFDSDFDDPDDPIVSVVKNADEKTLQEVFVETLRCLKIINKKLYDTIIIKLS